MAEETEPAPADIETQVGAEVAYRKLLKIPGQLFPGMTPPGATPASGGRGDGHYAISSIAELDSLIEQWKALLKRIDDNRRKIEAVKNLITPLAGDEASQKEATASQASMDAAITHNLSMRAYVQGYIDTLTAARHEYENTEGHNTTAINTADGA
ncbi:hypothetical protein [Actinokineospora iranica]|uniref:PE family protein n=1 Tax=Actinokineospora iranica TaxID=1271860 RepID=A0A1G6PL64_9PSEU|nr:hypothetical protein [Actinokineospora iranica]SDC80768.1 hypothetical protein SAMN05216174_104352 [Actinokineospora iranica]